MSGYDWAWLLLVGLVAGVFTGAGIGKVFGEGRASTCCSMGGELVEGVCVKKGSR